MKSLWLLALILSPISAFALDNDNCVQGADDSVECKKDPINHGSPAPTCQYGKDDTGNCLPPPPVPDESSNN